MRGDTRGRLTLPDLAEILAALAILGGLASVFYGSLDNAAQYLSTGEAYMWQLFFPVAVLVLFAVIMQKARAGAP